jgi:hypothetical protein
MEGSINGLKDIQEKYVEKINLDVLMEEIRGKQYTMQDDIK